MERTRTPGYLYALGGSLAAVFVWSRINPREVATWWLEVTPVIVGVPLLVVSYRRFPLTRLAYVPIWLHAIILLIGGHYTYAEVPLFNWPPPSGATRPAGPFVGIMRSGRFSDILAGWQPGV